MDVKTPGTKAVVGFTGGRERTLGHVMVHLDTPFASPFLTAPERKEDLAGRNRALITVPARQSNSQLHSLHGG